MATLEDGSQDVLDVYKHVSKHIWKGKEAVRHIPLRVMADMLSVNGDGPPAKVGGGEMGRRRLKYQCDDEDEEEAKRSDVHVVVPAVCDEPN